MLRLFNLTAKSTHKNMMLRSTQTVETYQILILFFAKLQTFAENFAWQLHGNNACDIGPPHIFVCPCAPHNLSLRFWGQSVLSGKCCSGKHRLSSANESQQCEWYIVYTDQQLVRNTSDTVYTTRHVCCECLASWHYLGFTSSACVCCTEGLDLCQHRGKRRRSFALSLCVSVKLKDGDRSLSLTSSVI